MQQQGPYHQHDEAPEPAEKRKPQLSAVRPVALATAHAHSLEGRPVSDWQKLDVHLGDVAELAAKFAKRFQSADWAWNAGYLHDIGKAEDAFQAYLRRENGLDDSAYDSGQALRVNHSSAGAAMAEQVSKGLFGRTLAYVVAGHHAGLPDYCPSDTGNAALSIRLKEGMANLDRISGANGEVRSFLRGLSGPPQFVKPATYHFWVRFLFSCLVDADFLDTEAFMQPQQPAMRRGFLGIPELKAAFDKYIDQMLRSASQTPVNEIRAEVLRACVKASQEVSGLFSLTVPTGGGKTLSSMAFALEHAVRHTKRRIIYVIPYTSIIEQTSRVFSAIFGTDQVVEHHSNLDPDRETPRSRLASENWDAPIIVTTNVQFFESLFAARSSRCRKLHNIVDSVVILDEAQLLPPGLLSPCLSALDTLADAYGVSIVLCTATQPALSDLPAPLPRLRTPREIVPDPKRLYERLKRTTYSFPADMQSRTSWEDLARELADTPQVLCIVNTRRDCYDLHKLMPDGTIHLSALMCGEHRSTVIAEIKRALKSGETVRVISTQLVEAGVDIDFPVVYRALAGLDSIAQAAGRCNREGTLNVQGALGRVNVFIPPKSAPRGMLLKGENTARELIATGFDEDSPDSFRDYFRLFYSKVNDTGAGYDDWLVRDVPDVHFRTCGENFQLIDSKAQRPVYVRYGDSERWIDMLRTVGPTREIFRHLQRYTVNLSRQMVELLLADGRLVLINPHAAPDAITQGMLAYDECLGLQIYAEHLPVEDLII